MSSNDSDNEYIITNLETTHISTRLHTFKQVTNQKIGNIELKDFLLHSLVLGYDLFSLKPKKERVDEYDPIEYGIRRNDINTHFKFATLRGLETVTAVTNEYDDSDEGDWYNTFSSKTFSSIKKSTSTDIKTYITKRIFFPDDDTVRQAPKKKVEFESCYQLCIKLYKQCAFKFQVNVLNFRVDQMLEIRDNYCIDIPPIGIEINEDGHKGYDKQDEDKRQKVIEYFQTRIFNVPIDRKTTDKQLVKIINKVVDDIKDTLKNLVIDFNPEITEERLCEIVQDNSVDKEFLPVFLNGAGESPYTDFKYCHTDVAEFLGYNTNNLRRRFNPLVKKIKACNYIVKTRTELKDYVKNRCDIDVTAVFTETFGLNKNGGQNQKFYFLNRVGFYEMCIASSKPKATQMSGYFVTVYEAVMNYVCRSRVRNIDRLVKVKKSAPLVEERVDKRVKDKVSKFTVTKLDSDNKKKDTLIEEMRLKILELTDNAKHRDSIIGDMNGKMREREMNILKLEATVKKLTARKTKYMNRCRGVKTELETLEQKYENAMTRLKKYEEKALSGSKYNTKIEKYKKIIDDNKGTTTNLKEKLSECEEKLRCKIIKNNKLMRIIIKYRDENKKPASLPRENKTKLIVESLPVEKTKLKCTPNKESTYTAGILGRKTMTELKDICRTNGIGGYSGKKKSILIEFMLTKNLN